MDARFLQRKHELIAEAQVEPGLFAGVSERLAKFTAPFVRTLVQAKQRTRAADFIGGLLSDVERKNAESIAYRCDQERQEMQYFLGESRWDHRPLLLELATQVGRDLGRPDGVIVFDPSAFPKKGTESVGVQRQWCGRLGKVENCQVGVYLGYVSPEEHALVNVRLYLPRQWARDRKRRQKCHVPREVRFQTRHALCLSMLDEMGHLLPHAWIAGDDEMGRSSAFRRELRARKEQYLLAVPSNTLIRDLESVPAQADEAAPRRRAPFTRVDHWRDDLPAGAWQAVNVRDGEKGPLCVEVVSWRVQAKTEQRRVGPEELLVIVRTPEAAGGWKYDFYLSNASPSTSPADLARVAKAEHRIEECLQRGKSEAGLADYEVRSWGGWHHHQTLSLIAAWFLNV
ncbi:MAG: IS701 family transposase, partial [Gemmatimonadaceae bacterium]